MIDFLLAELKKRIVVFQYSKVKGGDENLRTAIGTLRPDLLPPTKGEKKTLVSGLCVYYDVEKQAWRSFYLSRLRRVDLYESK